MRRLGNPAGAPAGLINPNLSRTWTGIACPTPGTPAVLWEKGPGWDGMKAAGKGAGSTVGGALNAYVAVDMRPQKEVPSSTYQLMPVGIVDTNELKSYAAELFANRGSSPPATSRPNQVRTGPCNSCTY